MITQLEALRLAHWVIDYALELHRLSAENEMLWKEREEPHKTIDMYVRECNRLESERDEARRTVREAHEAGTRVTAQRDALLEALKGVLAWGTDENWKTAKAWCEKARAAIKTAEGAQTEGVDRAE